MDESVLLNRVRRRGYGSALPPELLAIGAARRLGDIDAGEEAAKKFFLAGQGLRGLANLSGDVLTESFGLEGFEAARVLALLELGRRIATAGKGTVTQIQTPADVAELLQWLANEKQEHFVALLLDTKNKVLREAQIHIGTLDQSLVGVREVFREAIREGASSIIVAHNHPSGDPNPSPDDIRVTKKLVDAGELLSVPVRDHVIIGDRRWVSLHQEGLM